MIMALIFDIERFATKDGPGVRTAVFFKGCNMRCLWCHNPEGIHTGQELIYNAQSCIACGRCAGVCPSGANSMLNGLHLFTADRCIQCFACTNTCFSGALKKVGTEMSVDDVMREVMKDVPLYKKTGGGITLTGGEPMLQHDFVKELLGRCRDLEISTAMESNLSLPWEKYEEVLPVIDFLFVDIKHTCKEKHLQWTGINNDRILENFRRLVKSKRPYAVRTPVIPGFNDNIADIEAIAKLVSEAENLLYHELLTYNPLGKSKGELVNPPDIKTFATHQRESMRHLAEVANKITGRTRLDGNRVGNKR